MEFEKRIVKNKQLVPPDFTPEVQEIEYRIDPLTGSTSIINPKRAERIKQAEHTTGISDRVTQETRVNCPFCPERILARTSRFASNIIPEGLIQKGECHLFPNLFAFAEYHAVATVCRSHFLDLDQFTHQMIIDNMMAAREWMLSVYGSDQKMKFPVYMWNHLPPSGGSMVHPHVQVLMRQTPTVLQELLLRKSADYRQQWGRSYWTDLIQREGEIGQRNIAENDTLAIVTSFAPRGFREIQFIFKMAASFDDLNDEMVAEFTAMLVKVLASYQKMGVGSFNMITYCGPLGEKPEGYLMSARIISRPFPQGVYTNDTGTMERLQDEWVIETIPEDVAQTMRKFF